MGHDPEKVVQVINASKENHSKLYEGVGWGTSTALFKKGNDTKIYELNQLLRFYPDSVIEDLKKGIEFSFSEFVTPQLDREIFIKMKEEELLK